MHMHMHMQHAHASSPPSRPCRVHGTCLTYAAAASDVCMCMCMTARLATCMAHAGVVADVWSSCATDPACCCNELTTAPLTVTLQPNGVADADKWLSMANVCPPQESPPWQCPISALAPPQGAPSGSGQLGTPMVRGWATGRPATASGARVSRRQRRQLYCHQVGCLLRRGGARGGTTACKARAGD
jgi:hypothetical protein